MNLTSSTRAWLRRPPPVDRTSGAELLIAFVVALILPPLAFALASWRMIRHGRHVNRGWYLVDIVALVGSLAWLSVLTH
jgi:hypothetical protein